MRLTILHTPSVGGTIRILRLQERVMAPRHRADMARVDRVELVELVELVDRAAPTVPRVRIASAAVLRRVGGRQRERGIEAGCISVADRLLKYVRQQPA